jgi:spore coat protein U-like protein
MKKFIIILMVLAMAQATSMKAQTTDTDVVNFTAILQEVLNLNVTAGQNQTATFDTPDKYNLGIDAVGTTTITVESTGDWDLQINAADFSDGSGNSIPIDNLGLWCEATGVHQIGTEVSCSYTSLANALGLTATDQMLLDNLGGNGGDASDNAFNLNWTMGTMNGSMNTASIFQQVSDGTIGALGTYTTTVNLTLTAKP